MGPEIRLAAVAVVVMATFISLTSTEIFTSSLKIQRMVEEEDRLLAELKRFIDHQFVRLKFMSNFHLDRFRDISSRVNSTFDLRHPNAVFKAIKQFSSDYTNILGDQFGSFQLSAENTMQAYVADHNDVRGAITSLLRLQVVYNMTAWDMANGDYKGYQGPQLKSVDAYEIGQAAFTAGKINESIDWLQTSLNLQVIESINNTVTTNPSQWAIKALLGRVHMMIGSRQIAEELYNEALQLDQNHQEVGELWRELQVSDPPKFKPPPVADYFQNFSRLCQMNGGYDPPESVSPLAVCRYREAVLPYYRFQEEIISISPFATLFYNVISEAESEHIKGFVKNNLVRGKVGAVNSVVSDVRTGDLSWIYDHQSETVASISKRIECLTGLDTTQRMPGGPSSGEALQVVNYGLGGQYEVHMDPLSAITPNREFAESGDRIATFLIYLSDVEKGGSTVFTQAGLSVAPVKNMALMWYNFDPALNKDNGTHHAGCPVLIGQKWIVNKWIWTYGNTFRRRCGLTPDATQHDIEADMKNGYQ